ncbi:hypothetical protein G9A89_001619 [Geosiphon pyriformis]|nr:hypothetical protein G9A89_001619 [Geosiphon pyriformis]
MKKTFLNRITSSICRCHKFNCPGKLPEANSITSGPNSGDLTIIENAPSWNQAISEAELLVGHKGGPYIDPIKLLGSDLVDLTKNIKRLLSSGHPVLEKISKYYFTVEGKRIRPLIVLLMAQATSLTPKESKIAKTDYFQNIDLPLSSSSFNINEGMATVNCDSPHLYHPSLSVEGTSILPTQRRLAEITEMIHTATLLHDDVIDASESRRNLPSANANFGNKMAILAGDFLLARASVALARLRNPEVIELLATVIANLVEGEFMQLKNNPEGKLGSNKNHPNRLDYYMEKSYMKTASLMAKSCRAASVLGGCTKEVSDIAYAYGRNLGLAFQLVDDMLDFIATSNEFGKPVGADLKLGLATAPILYAWEEYPELGPLIDREFKYEGDIELAQEIVFKSKGLEKTKLLAASHCQKAIASILKLPQSKARYSLIQLTEKVLTRNR